MDDLLKKDAEAFNLLLSKEYHIIGGKKRTLIDIYINFKKDDFFHLAGLHKLKDIDILHNAGIDKADIFNKILDGEIKYQDISKSVFWDEVQGRVDNLYRLENLLDNENLFFRFYKNKVKGSGINADYVFYFESNEPKAYFFLTGRDENQHMCLCGCSFFPSQYNTYIVKQPRYTIIYKDKQYLTTHEKIIFVDKLKR